MRDVRHPDEIRRDLQRQGDRIAALRRERADAYDRVMRLAREGAEVGVSAAEAARLAGVTRRTLYARGLRDPPGR